MLGWRLILSPILIGALIGLFWLDARAGASAPILAGLALALALRCAWELVQLVRVRLQPHVPVVAVGVLAVVASNWLFLLQSPAPHDAPAARLGIPMLVYGLVVLVLFLSALIHYGAPGNAIETLGAELLTVTYAGLLISLTVQLRWIDAPRLGYLPLASLIIATKCGDSAAYFTGRLLGKTKLCPLISPGKTRAGAVGAVIGAAAGSVAWFGWAGPWLFHVQPGPWYWTAAYGFVLGLLGLVGDLAESLIKRDVGRKDSAPLLPGFGGLLDLLDSILFCGPVAYLLWMILPLAE